MLTPDEFADAIRELAFRYSVSDYEKFLRKGEDLMRATLLDLGQSANLDLRGLYAALNGQGYDRGVHLFQMAPHINLEKPFLDSTKKAED